jgi:DNA-directed RNA polymerase specialized sigma24 family protein
MLEAEKRGGKRQRVQARSADESFVALYELLGAVTNTPSREAATMEAQSAIQRVLELLPEDYKRVVRMYDLEGRPTQEVSDALKRRPGAVFMLRARAHRSMRRLLGNASKFFSGSA